MRLALLSNVTVEVLADMLRPAHEIWMPSGFGAWMQTALAVPEELKAFGPEVAFLLLDAAHAPCDPQAVETAVAALEAALPQTTVCVPDLADLAEEVGDFHDERMWKLAAMPWSLAGMEAICGEIERYLRALGGERRKVLALDFDNTLWSGVIGEDGLSGIQPHVELQREIKALRARGVLLVGLSKNNAVDVEPVWDDPRMVLKREDFVALRVDWNDKWRNLSAVAETLGLGRDSFVFVDDNPAERAAMAAHLPEVAIAAWPLSTRRLERLYFPKFRLTDEDLHKTAQYRAEAARRRSAQGLSLEEYLAGLDIRTEIHPVRADEYARVAQLSQKANQFNVCTNRHTAGDIARFAADPGRLLVTLHASDRFGDLGLVAFVHAVSEGDASFAIRDWVMSCRAMNRRLEFILEHWVERELVRRGAERITAVWRRTPRNEPVRELFDRFGFTRLPATPPDEALRKYVLVPPGLQSRHA